MVLSETQPVAGVTFTFRPWTSPEGLRKLMQGDAPAMAVMPAPTAALFEANGIHLTLLSATVTEGSLSIVGRGAPVSTLAELKGAKLALPFKGFLPDLLMRRIEAPGPDHWQPYYTGSLVAGMQLLLAGQVETALLAEPMASLAVARDTSLVRLASICRLWRSATALPECPPAGVVAMNPALIKRPELKRAYQDAFRRVADNPGSAAAWLSRFSPNLRRHRRVTAASSRGTCPCRNMRQSLRHSTPR